MVKKVLLSLSAMLALGGSVRAQHNCATDDVNNLAKLTHPEIAAYEAQIEADIQKQMKRINLNRLARTNGTNAMLDQKYVIPVVVHIVHDYGVEYISDAQVITMINHTNDLYLKRYADTSRVIDAYKTTIPGTVNRYMAKANIEFKLAHKDPQGNPTRGITRRRSVLTAAAGDQAKFDIWPPDSYINIWLVRTFNSTHQGAGAYAYKPASGASIPFYDGIIGNAGQTSGTGDFTLGHELGHVLNLDHTWGSTNEPEVDCFGTDAVDDTPPTKGHSANNGGYTCGPTAPAVPNVLRGIWDTLCVYNVATVGRDNIFEPALSPSDTSRTAGVTFKIDTRTRLLSVNVYPSSSAGLGAPFTIKLVNTGTAAVVSTVSATVSAIDTIQVVPVNATLLPGTYKMTFDVNPGMRRGPSAGTNGFLTGSYNVTGADTTGGFPFFYRMRIQYGYFRVYDEAAATALFDSVLPSAYLTPTSILIDYPDTVNVQNVMDYAFCDFMFTHGQALRMRGALNSDVAGRNNLWSSTNLDRTGVNDPEPSLPPVADFSVNRPFICADEGTSAATFTDRSWNATVQSRNWTFGNTPTAPSTTTATVNNVQFKDPGFVTVSLTATSAAGSTSITKTDALYGADKNPVSLYSIEEFEGSMDRWPMMNYYGNARHQWEKAEVGYYDTKAVRFRNFDDRNDPNLPMNVHTNAPDGVFSDLYTPAYNLSASAAPTDLNLNFMTASATRSFLAVDMRDEFRVEYSTDCGANWLLLTSLTGSNLANNGTLGIPFSPLWQGDWRANSINLAPGHPARTARTFFRFRYIARTDNGPDFTKSGSGNHFYLDRVLFTTNKLGIDEQILGKKGMIVAPNPTHGSSSIMLKSGTGIAQVSVTDMTGKVVFRTEQHLSSGTTEIVIPADRIAARGMYIVNVIAGNETMNEKLVVN